MYLSNACVNDCEYCAFRRANQSIERRVLNKEDITTEVEALVGVGHNRLIAVYSEHPDSDADTICRTVDNIYTLCQDGHLLSFCTAGYREGRTGVNFMPLAKHATVNQYCIANGLLSFKEYLMDYASDRVKEIGERKLIPRYLQWIEKHVPHLATNVHEKLKLAEQAVHDLHF